MSRAKAIQEQILQLLRQYDFDKFDISNYYDDENKIIKLKDIDAEAKKFIVNVVLDRHNRPSSYKLVSQQDLVDKLTDRLIKLEKSVREEEQYALEHKPEEYPVEDETDLSDILPIKDETSETKENNNE